MEQLTCTVRDSCAKVSSNLYVSIENMYHLIWAYNSLKRVFRLPPFLKGKTDRHGSSIFMPCKPDRVTYYIYTMGSISIIML